jgi:hypothetical protein
MIDLYSIAKLVSTAMHFVTDKTGFSVKEKIAASSTLAGEDCWSMVALHIREQHHNISSIATYVLQTRDMALFSPV